MTIFLLQVKVSNLDGKVLGLYFSANWYPPCRSFNQILVQTYEELQGNGSNFEVVYVSSDEDSDAFNEYHASMPWPAIPFSDLETKIALNRKFEIEGIPCLVILQPCENKDETMTLHEGVEIVYRYGVDAFPFTKERLEQLKEEDREKEENQTLFTLLINHNRDYLLSHPISKQVSLNDLETFSNSFYNVIVTFIIVWLRLN